MLTSIAIACLPFLPQTPCGSPGPDLVMGHSSGIANYTSSNGIEALSVGYEPYNVGSTPVIYSASTPNHPVYGSSLYRLKTVAGALRMEEIGQSWLRHGFFALSQGTRCTCTPTDGTELGIGCADSMSSAGGAGTIGWGPRWQINAATGAFPYPPANPPRSGLNRLLQVHVADLEPTGGTGAARYFVESQAIAADDAAAGNGDNNSSYREVGVAGSGTAWTFALMGTTQEERPAIYAWQDADPGVTVSDVHVPSDGRLLLASRATDLGGGLWHYEYALHNQSSHRNARSFLVPVPAAGNVSNTGFHDVDYHSGDGPGNVNFDGTDWNIAVGGGQVVFSTDTFAANPSANAVRWSTTYNFRFDSDLPPVNGSVSVGLFEPGTPTDVSIPAVVPVSGPPPFMSFCFGDGSAGPCPCGNVGMWWSGCDNSAGTGGALLSATGNASLSNDTVVLTSSGELPTSLSIVIQGNATISPVNFGDGLRCAGGTLKRLYVRSASGGVVIAPQAGDPSVSARSAALGDPLGAGANRDYQTYYRDGNPTFCPSPAGSTFNATGAVAITWGS
ncbi:MAG: hypothetical protein ACKVXR_08960 [Planctomycetota bacterium]